MTVRECECEKSVCVFCFVFRAGASVRSLHAYVKTSSVDLYQKPKTLQSVLVSLVLRLDESNKIDKLEKKKNYHSSSGILFRSCQILVKRVCFLFLKIVSK